MVTPLPVVRNIHTLFALAECWSHRTVGLNDRFIEKTSRLLLPHLDANIIDRLLQSFDIARREPPTKVARRGRIGNTLGTQGIEIHFIVAQQLKVFETIATAKMVVCDIQHVV